MMPNFLSHATLAAVIAVTTLGASCRSTATPDANTGKAVSGRVATGTGLSFDFGDGWSEVPAGTSPFTKVYRNPSRQLEMRLAEASSGGLAITTHGDQMRRGLSVDGSVESAGAVTIAGRPGYRCVVKKKTPTGFGVVVGETVLYTDGRITTVYVSSTGDEKTDHRAEIDAILATLQIA